MKSRKLSFLTLTTFLLISSFSYSQVQTARPTTVSGACGGYYEYLPQGYSSNTWQNYPLIIAVHGIGEIGNGTSDLGNLLNCWTAIPRLIANGGFPSSFNVGGQNFSFIVISPQFNRWPYASDVNAVVDYAVQHYRVDQSRIYVTGLSMGGGAVWDFAGNYPTKAAAVVPVCGAASSDPTRAQAIASAKLPVWATHNQDDPTVSVSNTTGWVSLIGQYGGNIQSTIFPTSGHDAWSKTYDPNFTQNGVNVYQWMLQHQKGSSTTSTPPPPPAVNNQSPTANAGPSQTITLPTSAATLMGTGSDPDGNIAFWEWKQASGPSTATVASPYSANTVVSNLVQGSYVFTLNVTDNQGATATSNVTVNVNAAANQAPVANAGADQTITLPQSSVTLGGTASDPDGTINSSQWTQASGPAQATIASAGTASTLVSNLVQGSYVFTLKVTDNQGATATSNVTVNVNAAANQAPTANAGADQSITLPTSATTLTGTGSDPDGNIAFWEWKQASGPSTAIVASPYSANTVVSNLVQGSYVFTLKVTDNQGATATSNVTVNVNAAANQAPVANAGADQSITLPQSSVTLSGTASDPDGTISSSQWTQASGPAQATIASAGTASTLVSNLVQGSYVFTLKVTDNQGATATSNVTVNVNAAANLAPTANAGEDQRITLPQSSIILIGSGSDPDGTIATYQWSQVSGPAQSVIGKPGATMTTISNLQKGTYVLRFTVTDDRGATAWDEVTITVLPAPNQLPTVSAGVDQTITLPLNSVDLSGTAFDPDGTISSVSWTQTSGPTKMNFSSASPLTLTVRDLLQGIYTFRLTVVDNDGATAWDDVKVTVLADPRTQSTATVYPNPATSMINVKIDALTLQTNTVIHITNAAGSTVYAEEFKRTDYRMVKQVDISKLPDGIYFLSLNTDINTIQTLKFTKQ
jgi:dienelactone hydrolase